MRLLIVENAQDLAHPLLRVGFRPAGCAADVALTGADAQPTSR